MLHYRQIFTVCIIVYVSILTFSVTFAIIHRPPYT